MENRLIARWETRGKRYWYELYYHDINKYYHYRAENGGGSLGIGRHSAFLNIRSKIASAREIDNINYKQVI